MLSYNFFPEKFLDFFSGPEGRKRNVNDEYFPAIYFFIDFYPGLVLLSGTTFYFMINGAIWFLLFLLNKIWWILYYFLKFRFFLYLSIKGMLVKTPRCFKKIFVPLRTRNRQFVYKEKSFWLWTFIGHISLFSIYEERW